MNYIHKIALISLIILYTGFLYLHIFYLEFMAYRFIFVSLFWILLMIGALLLHYWIQTPNRLIADLIKNRSNDAILITNKHNKIIYANKTFLTLTGYAFEEVKGKNPKMFKSDNKNPDFYKHMWKTLLKEGHFVTDLWGKKKNGVLFLKQIDIYTVKNRFGSITNFMSVQIDITESYTLKKQYENLLRFENTTHLPSIKRMSELIQKVKLKDKPFYVVFVRITNQVNIINQYTQAFYDSALLQYNETIYRFFDSPITVGEYNSETLIIIFEDMRYKKREFMKALDAISKEIYVDGTYITLENKYGLSHYPSDKTQPEALIHSAQTALNSGVSKTTKYAIYDQSIEHRSSREGIILDAIHQAIQAEDFYVVYQPQYDIKTGKIIVVEALLRWLNPPLKNVGPQEFIPIAESYGYIGSLTKFVLRSIIKDIPKIQAHRSEIKVAINLSTSLFSDKTWLNEFKSILQAHPKQCAFLEIELTENFLIDDLVHSVETIDDFHTLGLSVAIDDFGSGFSSLQYLKTLPIDKIKIDKAFVDPLKKGNDDFIKTIISLGKTIHSSVLAEGVETKQQYEFLRLYGCHYVQGFYLAKPMKIQQLRKFMDQ